MSVKSLKSKAFTKGNNYLFVVAINDYKNSLPPLSNCINDARDLVQLLVSEYQFEQQYTLLLENETATRKNLLTELKNYKDKLRPEDNLVVVFSGHGANIDGIGYWIPADATGGDETTYISSDDIINRLNLIKCHHLLLLVDACFSGSIFRNVRSAPAPKTLVDETRASRWGLSASHSREVASDGDSGENSPFMKFLLLELKTRRQPTLIQEIASGVMRQVQEATQDKQTPIFRPLDVKGDELGQFVFHPKHAFYTFDNVLSFLQAGKEEEALVELEQYCRTGEQLPEGYEYELALLFYRARKYEMDYKKGMISYFDYNHFISKSRFFQKEKLNINSHLQKSNHVKFRDIINLIAQADIAEALEKVIDMTKSEPLVYQAFLLMSMRFKLVERNFVRGQIDFIEYSERLEEYLELFLLQLKKAESNSLDIYRKKESIEQALKESELFNALILTKDLLTAYSPKSEEWHLLKMVIQMYESFRYKLASNPLTWDERSKETNRITRAIYEIINKVKPAEITFDKAALGFLESHDSIRGTILGLIEWGELEKLLTFLQECLPNAIFIDQLINEFKAINNISTMANFAYIERYQVQIAEKLLQYLNVKPETPTAINTSVVTSRNKEEQLPFNASYYFNLLWEQLRSGGDWKVVIDMIHLFDLAPEQKWQLQFLEYQWKQNNEDKFFTHKSPDLIQIRAEKIYDGLLNLMQELKPKSTSPKNVKATSSEVIDELLVAWERNDYKKLIQQALQLDLPFTLTKEFLLIQFGLLQAKVDANQGIMNWEFYISMRSQLIGRLTVLMQHERLDYLLGKTANEHPPKDSLSIQKIREIEDLLSQAELNLAFQHFHALSITFEVECALKALAIRFDEISADLKMALISFDSFILEQSRILQSFLQILHSIPTTAAN